MQYFFILGRNPTLSVAEILSLINTNLITNNTNIREICGKFVKIREISEEVLILETKEKLDCQKLQARLGGTIKIGQILTLINADLTQIGADLFLKELSVNSKVYFGFSLYNLEKGINLKSLKLQIKKLALEIKKKLKEKNIFSRWVESKERILSSVIVQKNKLLTQGAEFCFFLGTQMNADKNTDQYGSISENLCTNQRESAYVGKTLTCQKFEEYERMDFGRPARKIEEGMMPPKLAKIMINLAQAPENGVILDPFCGSGTIVQEAVLNGYKNIVGTDINQEAVHDTELNLGWLTTRFKKPATTETQNDSETQRTSVSQRLQENINISLFQSDVRNLSQEIPQNSIDAIITEPYLGPIKISNIKYQKSKITSELSNLYLAAFREFKKVLKKNGRVVIIFPVFKIDKKLYFLPILDQIQKSGWQIFNPIPENLRNNAIIKITNRGSIIYSRPDQKVLREIFIFTQR